MLGIFFALGAASSWTYSCYLWRQQAEYFSPIKINLIKNIIAFCIFLPILFTIDFKSNLKEIGILLVSGIIGIAIGDSFYITSLKKLGTRRTLTVEALSPFMATILGSFLLNEIPPFKVWIGIICVSISLVGIAFYKTGSQQFKDTIVVEKDGFIFAFISVLCAVVAANFSRLVLINSNLNPFQTSEIRLIGSLMALLPFARSDLLKSMNNLSLRNKYRIVFATLLGTNLGIFLQQNVFQILPIGLAWTLLSVSPAFSLLLAKNEGEFLNWESILLTFTVILGVIIAFI